MYYHYLLFNIALMITGKKIHKNRKGRYKANIHTLDCVYKDSKDKFV